MKVNTLKVNIIMAQNGLNQKDLAQAANVSRPTVSNAVRGSSVSPVSIK